MRRVLGPGQRLRAPGAVNRANRRPAPFRARSTAKSSAAVSSSCSPAARSAIPDTLRVSSSRAVEREASSARGAVIRR